MGTSGDYVEALGARRHLGPDRLGVAGSTSRDHWLRQRCRLKKDDQPRQSTELMRLNGWDPHPSGLI